MLVSIPIKLTYSPQPRGNRYFTLLPINGDSGVDRGPLSLFAMATLHVASREGQGDDMAIQIKLPPCFGSSKHTKYKLIMEAVLSRGPLWHNVHYMEHKNNGEVIISRKANPYVRSWRSACAPPPVGGLNTHPLAEGICPADSSGMLPRMGRLSRPG